ncbi:hypothetical protein HanPI659440_Chr05g0192761 [Helianthus annuus]|nr:hypothetical protein HanPI659440_Chr05g0192761 [Helianthus annuus]
MQCNTLSCTSSIKHLSSSQLIYSSIMKWVLLLMICGVGRGYFFINFHQENCSPKFVIFSTGRSFIL